MDDMAILNQDRAHEAVAEDEELKFETICLRRFVELKLPPREMLLSPILPQKGLAMLYAGRGIGKTHVALGITYAVSCGTTFLRWKAEERGTVLYVDGEMPQQSLQERLSSIMEAADEEPFHSGFRLLSMDRQKLGSSLNLANPKHQAAIDDHLAEMTDLLVLDNMSTLMNGGPENDAESWDSMQGWLLQLRRRGVTVLVVHHASRNGNARGTSKREDVLDTVIQLKHPDGYDPSEGARFEVHLTKARGLFGDEALPFEARMETDDAGRTTWVCSDLDEESGGIDAEVLEEVLALKQKGMTIRAIADKRGTSKSTIERQLKQAKKLAERKKTNNGDEAPGCPSVPTA